MGNFDGVVVQNNIILGGFATDGKEATQKFGSNANSALIKYVVFQWARDLFSQVG